MFGVKCVPNNKWADWTDKADRVSQYQAISNKPMKYNITYASACLIDVSNI